MSESNSEKSLTIPKWDGKSETCPRYLVQVEALTKYYECGEAMDETDMANCPTKSEYAVLDLTQISGKAKAKFYKQNKRICAIMVLGQGSDHGLAVIQETKTPNHPHGLAWKIVGAMMKKNKPKDASAEIEMDGELEKISFGTAQDYYNQVVAVIARYDVKKTNTELIKLMAKIVLKAILSS